MRATTRTLLAAAGCGTLLFGLWTGLPARGGRVVDGARFDLVPAPRSAVASARPAPMAVAVSRTTRAPPESARIATQPGDAFAPDVPRADAPLRDSYDALAQAARAGDTHAACRLGAELSQCVELQRLQPWTRDPNDGSASARREQAALVVAQQRCEGFDVAAAGVPLRWFALAARRGDRAAMRAFLDPLRLAPTDLVRDPSLATLFRSEAPGYFAQLLRDGDLGLLRAWVHATHQPDAAALSTVLPPAWREPGLLRALVERLDPARRDALGIEWNRWGPRRAPPTAAQRAEAERLHAAHFAASPPPPAQPGGDEDVTTMLGTARYGCGAD